MNTRKRCAGVLFCSLLLACSGEVSSPGQPPPGGGPNPPGGGGGIGGGGNGGNQPMMPVNCLQPQASALQARLLTPSQYSNSVQDILQVTGDPAKGFTGGGFSRLDESALEQRANAAAAVALSASKTLAMWAPCSPPAVEATACEQQIIDRIGTKVFRRPLTADDRAQMKTLFDSGVKEKDFATGVQWFLTGMLQAPDFLYIFARPAANEKVGQVVAIEAHDVASRLAYFIWDSTPDDALMAVADTGKLTDVAELRTQVTRMLGDQRFMRGVSSFYSGWLNLPGFAEVSRDDKDFTGAVATSLATSLLTTATQIYSTPSPNLSALLSGASYPLNSVLRTFYGRPAGGTADAFAPVAMDGEGRRGIITHPGMMTLMSRPGESNPISRGLFVRRTLLCQHVPAPPTDIMIPPLPPVAAGLSTRDRLDQHTKNAVCKACHDIIDPPGFALESFDHVGRFRKIDSGKAVDTSGDMTDGADIGGPFANGEALLTKMADSRDIRSCFARNYMQHALSRGLEAADECSADKLAPAFAASGDLKQLIISIAAADSFRMRLAEGVAP